MGSEKSSIKKLRQRFVKDYNLPINIFDEKYFEYYRQLYPFFPNDVWEKIVETIGEKYNGNVEEWLNYCAQVRDNAIIGTMDTDEYKKFNTEDMSKWDIDPEIQKIGEHSIYNEKCDGKGFVSIDMKKANFQALKYAGVINDSTYADFIYRHGGDEYIANSKYLRQVIFGKMNPGRTIKVEKYIMGEIYKMVRNVFDSHFYDLYSMNSDEIVFKQRTPYDFLTKDEGKKMEEEIKNRLGIDVRVENIVVKCLKIVNANGNKVDAYVKKNMFTGEEVLKKASTTFYPQIYKLWKGQDINLLDRGFFFEDQIAIFTEPLRFRKDEDNSK